MKQGSRVTIEADGTISADDQLPVATDSVLGGVKQGNRVTIGADGTISADDQLPVATDSVLGGVKQGNRVTIGADGTISADDQLPVATDSVLGGVKQGSRVTIGADGTISADYQLPLASTSDSTKVITVNSSGNYILDAAATSTYDTTFTSGTLAAVGGIPLNTPYTDLVGQSITTILDMMLYPVQYPTIKQPNANISLTRSGLQIIGDTLNHVVKFTFHSNDNKVIKVDNSTVSPYSGVIKEAYHDSFGSGTDTAFLGSGADGAFTSHTDIEPQTITNRVVTEGVSTMTVKIKWENGTYQPLDSAGNNFSTTYTTATNFLIKQSTVTGVYPRFLATSSGTFNQMTLTSHTTNNQEFNQDYTETSNERHSFQISKSP